jgi:diacylglycerol O-acyltransferase / wax synthase
MLQFNPIDAALLFLENTRTPFHVSSVSIYDPSSCPDGPPSFEDIVEAIRRSLPAVKPFRRKIVRVPLDLDYPYWVEDEDFDLEFHMRQIALPAPGNWEQFRTQVSRLISRPVDLSRSPWEMTVIEGLDNLEGLPPGCFATVLKIHHCAIDGETGVALINAIHSDSPKTELKELDDDWQPEQMPSNRHLLIRAAANGTRRPVAVTRLVLSNARKLVKAAFAELRNDDDDENLSAPPTVLNAPVSAHRIFDFTLASLSDLKRARKAVPGATINDVCLTIVAGCLRRYLEAKDSLPSAPLVTVVPISTRTPDQVGEGGNQIAITRISMYTHIADPIERLRAIAESTREKKAMQDGVVMNVLLDVVHNLPGALVGVASRTVPLLVAKGNSFANTMVTNVPGPMQPIYFLGARAVHMYGSPPLMDGAAILHSVGSYNGEFMFCFTACRDLLPDPDFYGDCLRAATQDVVTAADALLEPEPA